MSRIDIGQGHLLSLKLLRAAEPGGLKGPVASFFPGSAEVSESFLVSHPSSSSVVQVHTKDVYT